MKRNLGVWVQRAWLLCGVAVLVMLGAAGSASAQSVVFINPGKSNEAYWSTVTQAMQQAARSLGMDLEVLYAERNRLQPIALAKEVVQRPSKLRPKYLVIVNEFSVAPELLRITEGSGIQVFMAFSGIQPDLRTQTGRPRERYAQWIGSLEPKAEDAGYLTTKALIEHARTLPQLKAANGMFQMVAISGDRSTPVSIARNAGMHRAVQEAKDVVFAQEVFGEWQRDRAQQQAQVLYQRYPEARLVWAGSDQMAFGAMEAWRQLGGAPGKTALFSGINTSQEALSARQRGDLSALAGGHFMAGAWSLVMLYDHARGIDFAQEGTELEFPMFVLLDNENIPAFEARFGQLQSRADYKAFSKFNNPQLKKYDFDIKRLLR